MQSPQQGTLHVGQVRALTAPGPPSPSDSRQTQQQGSSRAIRAPARGGARETQQRREQQRRGPGVAQGKGASFDWQSMAKT
jgi:hypothetical protein